MLTRRAVRVAGLLLLLAQAAAAEVVRIEVRRRDDAGTHERVIGRVFFEIDPTSPANRAIADLTVAPRNAGGRVEFSGDVLFFRPKDAARARGTVFLEVVNRGRDQSLAIMSGARQRDLTPESWELGDRFHLEQGFTVAFVGWQFDVEPSQGLTFQAPVAPVSGLVRSSYISTAPAPAARFALSYCASAGNQPNARLIFRTRMEDAPRVLPREAWQFTPDRCGVQLATQTTPGLYEAVYEATGSPVAGLGLAALRDFASYLKHGADGATLREDPSVLRRVVGFGYSQSGRLLREFVRDGFNADERGRIAFDGLMIASAGAGGGSFNHRFAMPGQAGNSVLSILRPVDLPPFTDEGLLARARTTSTVPKIFYTFSSTEYWARAGSLTHTTEDGTADVPLAPTSRLYFISGTPHSGGPLPLTRGAGGEYQHNLNFAQQRWTMRALLLEMDAWLRAETAPPPSVYPTLAKGELVPLDGVKFPAVRSMPFAAYMPRVWRLDYGPLFAATRVITNEPPTVGAALRVLVPQVDADGNDVGGIRIPEIAAPLGTHTGWNVSHPQLSELHYLAGLLGSFEPFARTAADRQRTGDQRPSIAERYSGRQEYLARMEAAARDLVRQRFLRDADVAGVIRRGEEIWAAVVSEGSR
jgi:hypothetical protein